MTFIVKARVKDTTTSTGTGPYTMANSTVTNYKNFTTSMANGDTAYVMMVNRSANEWQGAYMTWNGTQLVFTQFEESSTGSQISFSAGIKDCFIYLPAKASDALDINGNFIVGGAVAPYSVAGRGVIAANGSTDSVIAVMAAGSVAAYLIGGATTASLISVSSLSVNASAGTLALLAGGANVMTFSTNGSERARIDSSGNLCVGSTEAWGGKFGVTDTTTNTFQARFMGNARVLRFGGDYLGGGYIDAANSAQSAYAPLFLNASVLMFGSNGAEAARIDSSGNLLIGTTSVGGKLTIAATPTSAWGADFSQCTVSIANGGNVAIPVGCGLIVLTDTSVIGNTGVYVAGQGVSMISASGSSFVASTTTPGAGKASVAFDGTNIRIYNNLGGNVVFGVMLLRTRTVC